MWKIIFLDNCSVVFKRELLIKCERSALPLTLDKYHPRENLSLQLLSCIKLVQRVRRKQHRQINWLDAALFFNWILITYRNVTDVTVQWTTRRIRNIICVVALMLFTIYKIIYNTQCDFNVQQTFESVWNFAHSLCHHLVLLELRIR